jgi:hypothetical protein
VIELTEQIDSMLWNKVSAFSPRPRLTCAMVAPLGARSGVDAPVNRTLGRLMRMVEHNLLRAAARHRRGDGGRIAAAAPEAQGP